MPRLLDLSKKCNQDYQQNSVELNVNQYLFSDSYGWDQSEKFVKIYITSLKDISSVLENNVLCNFQPKYEFII